MGLFTLLSAIAQLQSSLITGACGFRLYVARCL